MVDGMEFVAVGRLSWLVGGGTVGYERSSIGRAPVSKTGGWGFDSLRSCSPPPAPKTDRNDSNRSGPAFGPERRGLVAGPTRILPTVDRAVKAGLILN